MEKDDEWTGVTGSHLNFGARIYDSRVGRWLSVDPSFSSYPDISPFAYTGNNPILFIDKDGRDYGVYVNHDDRTIIIRATIYTTKGDDKSHEEAMHITNFWNAESGNFEYKVGKGDDAITYSVSINVDVVETDNPQAEMTKDRATFISDEEKTTPDASSNSLEVLSDENFEVKETYDESGNLETRRQARGYTKDGAIMEVHEEDVGSNEGPHEMGHVLGISHSRRLMNPTSYGSTKVIRKHIKSSLENAFYGGENATGTVYETGDRPDNFTGGKIKKTD